MRGQVMMLAVAVMLTAGANAAAAQGGPALTAPAYPGNTISLQRDEPIVAGTVVRVRMSGHAHWNRPDDPFGSGYGLWLYVQDATADRACEPWYRAQLQKSINIAINATTAISGFVMDGEREVQREPPNQDVDWATESAPFTVRPGVRRVVLCAYQRYIIDDVASYQLPVRVEQPSCRATPSTIRRGRRLALACNVSGAVTVRFAGGGRTRTVSARLSTEDGTGRLSTRRLRSGRYRVTVRAGDLQLGRPLAIRVR